MTREAQKQGSSCDFSLACYCFAWPTILKLKGKNAKPCCVSAQFKSMCLALSAIAPAVNERQILGERKRLFRLQLGKSQKSLEAAGFSISCHK